MDTLFDGLFGYERVMLLCGVVLFVFTLVLIGILVAQRRKFLPAIALLVVAIVLIGFPGIQTVKFSQDMVELDRIRAQAVATTDPAQHQQAVQTLDSLEQRAAGNPQLEAKVADGYRAVGDVDKAYEIAQSVLSGDPSSATRQTLVPVLTAKLRQSTPAQPGAAPVDAQKKQEIDDVASQLQKQAQAVPLSADSHMALANAQVAIGQPQQAALNVEAARRIDPQVRINPALRDALRRRGHVVGEGH
jgi:hypothetical protein